MELILGTAGISAPYGILHLPSQRNSVDEWVSSLRDLRSLGFSGVDTAPVYGDAEELLGRAGVTVPIHTKLSPGVEPLQSLAQSLARIRRNRVSVLYFHETFSMEESQVQQIEVLASARGKFYDQLGASIYDEDEYDRALVVPEIDVIQVPFSVLDRRFGGGRLTAARAGGKHVLARSVFLQGTLLSDPHRLTPALSALAPSIARFREICEGWSTSPIAAALGYVKHMEGFSGVIVGAKSTAEASHVAEIFSEHIPSGLIQDLDSLVTPSWTVTDPRTWNSPEGRRE